MAKKHGEKNMDHVQHHSKHHPEHETPFVHGGGAMKGDPDHVDSHKPHADHVRDYLHGK